MTEHRAGHLAVVSISVIVGLALLGCSGGDEESTSTSPERPDSTSTTEVSVPVFDGEADSEYCRLSGDLITIDLEDSPESLRGFYERFDANADQLVVVAPEEIADDVERFVDGVRSIRGALEEVDFDSSELEAADVPVLQDPEFPASGNRVIAYSEQVCNGETLAGTPGPGT